MKFSLMTALNRDSLLFWLGKGAGKGGRFIFRLTALRHK